jgi:hypothetical protein
MRGFVFENYPRAFFVFCRWLLCNASRATVLHDEEATGR